MSVMTTSDFYNMIDGVRAGDAKSIAAARAEIHRVADASSDKALLFMLYGMKALMERGADVQSAMSKSIAIASN